MNALSLISQAKSRGASDLHMKTGAPPLIRVHGALERLDGIAELTKNDMAEILEQMTSQKDRDIFQREMELDFGYTVPDVTRIRANVAVHRGNISVSLRLIPNIIPSLEELHLPELCKDLVQTPRGLVIVSGPTGSGKSSTLASMLDYLNHNQSRRIVTVEDPIEYTFTDDKCSIMQRELGNDTLSFGMALKHVLRQDPDVIMVGEMRDTETASAALILAETGHLVLTTGHAPSSSQAVERVIDLFPLSERHFAQTRMASLLIGIMCQTLVPTADKSGRVPAVELMLANPAVRNLIREGKIHQLPNVIRTNAQEGMKMLDQSLIELYVAGLISGKSLLAYCNDRAEVERVVGEINVKRNGYSKVPVPLYSYSWNGNGYRTEQDNVNEQTAEDGDTNDNS